MARQEAQMPHFNTHGMALSDLEVERQMADI
jgi:hypothetical protein